MNTQNSIALGFLPAIFLLGATGCNKSSPAAPPTAKEGVTSVKVVHPERKTIRRIIEQPGQIMAIEHAPIHARIPGYVSEVCVDMNSAVKKGQVLARLSVPEMEDDLKHKESLVVQAKAELQQSKQAEETAKANLTTVTAVIAEVEAARKRVKAHRERWTSEYERMDKLVRSGVIDLQTRDEARNQVQAAEASCDEVEAKIKSALAAKEESNARLGKASADITAAQAHVSVATADAQRLRSMLAYKEIIAPFDGVVTQRNVHTGHLVKPGQGGNTEPLFVLVRNDRVRIFVEVPEGDAPYIFPETDHACHATMAHLRIQASKGKEIDAPVTRTSWTLDPANRTLRVEIELPTAGTELRPGMYAYATFTIEHANVWCLPASSIISKDDGNYCYRVEQGKALLTQIRIGIRDGATVEILKQLTRLSTGAVWDDIKGSEQVIPSNPAALTDGQQVDLSATRD